MVYHMYQSILTKFSKQPINKVQVGKDQEKAQSEKRFPLKKPRWEKNKLTIRYLYHETCAAIFPIGGHSVTLTTKI